ncbi:MAG: hypothetical protein K8S87_09355 [Planctomycetes bacterium]|nr:hypothetical protein [Planctomycetota bacterium]
MFTKHSGRKFNIWVVEHDLWCEGGNPYLKKGKGNGGSGSGGKGTGSLNVSQFLPDSYVPPVVEILPKHAKNDEKLEKLAKTSGTNVLNAFEKYVNIAFTIIGYDTKLLGQCKGRVPDGFAIEDDNKYVIIWDAKVRSDKYSMGTEDRTIREYIFTQSRDLKKKRSFKNIYYVIVSSGFSDDFEDAIYNLKMNTDVNEVILMEADALVEIVNTKLRNIRELSLGSDGIQRLFTNSGILTKKQVTEFLQ